MSDFNILGEIELREKGNGFNKAADGAERLDKSLQKARTGVNAFDVAAGSLFAGGVTAIADMFVSGAQAAFEWGVEATAAGSSAAETASLLDTVLGPSLQDYESRIESVAERTGASVNALREGTKIFAVLAESAGFAQAEAANLAAKTGEIALDLNSFFDRENGLEAIQQAYKGESEGLAQFGIDVREAALQDIAFRQGIIQTGEALDKQSRILAVNAAIQEQAAKAMGDAERTADGFANTGRALTGVFEDFKTEVGKSLVDAIGPLQKEILGLSRGNLPELAGELDKIIEKTGKTALGIVELTKRISESDFGRNYAAADQAFVDFQDRLNERGSEFFESVGIPQIDFIELADEAIAAQERLEQGALRGGGRGARGSIAPIIEARQFEEAIELANSYDQVLSNISGNDLLDFSGIESADFGAINTFFDDVAAGSTSTIDSFQKIGRAISDTRTELEGLATADIANATANIESNALDEFASITGERGFGIEDQAAALKKAGASVEDINARIRDVLEKGAAEVAAAYVEAGGPIEDAFAMLEEFQAQIDSSDNPIELAQDDALGLKSRLEEIGASVFTPTIEIQFVGTDRLDQIEAQINRITGADLGGLDFDNGGAIGGPSAGQLQGARQ